MHTYHFVLWTARRRPNNSCYHYAACSEVSKRSLAALATTNKGLGARKQIVCDHIKGQAIKEAHWEAHYQVPPRQIQGAFPAQLDLEDHQQRLICTEHLVFIL